jgi:glycine/D-amino acid oxidase-like deaminating enzyme
MYDYLVIGLGIAGLAFCETLEEHGKTFRVIDDDSRAATKVAGGLYNPVVLKRLKLAWSADKQLPLVAPFYSGLQEKLGVNLHFPGPILRKFASAGEQNQWYEASDTPALRPYLSPNIVRLNNTGLTAPWGFGEVSGTGRVDTGVLLAAYANLLTASGKLIRGHFHFNRLECRDNHFIYGPTRAVKLVFATGMGLLENPFFNYLPLQGNKGEYLEIVSPGLKLPGTIKASVFIIPKGSGMYSAGATYDRRDSSPATTTAAAKYLMQKLDALLQCPYQVTGQTAGIRPTVPDRRPLLGEHPEIKGMYVLNGFGSRGVMLAPYAASALYGLIENGVPPDEEIDIRRYESRFFNAGRQQAGHNG